MQGAICPSFFLLILYDYTHTKTTPILYYLQPPLLFLKKVTHTPNTASQRKVLIRELPVRASGTSTMGCISLTKHWRCSILDRNCNKSTPAAAAAHCRPG